MRVLLMRHGATESNAGRRYAGRRTDEPLSEAGRESCRMVCEAVRAADGELSRVRTVHASPMTRTRETATLCFPDARVVPVPGLEEMDFGDFEGRSVRDLEHDTIYRAWVDGGCLDTCPGGESYGEFKTRTCRAILGLLDDGRRYDEGLVVVVAHGGTVMAALDDLCVAPFRRDSPFEWHVGTCEGYLAEVIWEADRPHLADPRHVRLQDGLL